MDTKAIIWVSPERNGWVVQWGDDEMSKLGFGTKEEAMAYAEKFADSLNKETRPEIRLR